MDTPATPAPAEAALDAALDLIIERKLKGCLSRVEYESDKAAIERVREIIAGLPPARQR